MGAVMEILGVTNKSLESMTPVQARNMLYVVDKLLADTDDDMAGDVLEGEIPDNIFKLQDRHASTMEKLANQLKDKEITIGEFNKGAHDTISKSFRKSYAAGLKGTLGPGDDEWLRRATEAEFGYARKFGEDVKAGRGMAISRRAKMYGQTLHGSYWNAWVEKLPDSARIEWVLGKAEHCEDCIILAANSPFTKWNLPTTPKSGATICRSHCKCKLVARIGKLTKKEREQATEFRNHKGEDLTDMLKQPPPPKGMRHANDNERIYIDNLWAKVYYNRRLIATTQNKATLEKAVKARKGANAELIEFLEKENIYETTLWSVDDVIDGRHIGFKAEADIFRAGLDGETLALLNTREIKSLLAHYGDDLEKILASLTEADEELPDPEISFFERGAEEYAIVADGLEATMLLAGKVLLAARGLPVQVGPFEDDLMMRTHVWIRGPREEVAKVLDKVGLGNWVAVPVEIIRRRT